MKITVIHFVHTLYGGVASVAANIINDMQKNGNKCVIAYSVYDPAIENMIDTPCEMIKVDAMNFPGSYMIFGMEIRKTYRYYCQKHKDEKVICHVHNIQALGSCGNWSDIPLICTLHSLCGDEQNVRLKISNMLYTFALKRLIRYNKKITSVSKAIVDYYANSIVDIISDVNMAYSEHARRYLADCGLPKERTYVTGSPMAEVLHDNLEKIEASDVHARLGLEKGKYILLSAHREENIDTEKNFLSLFEAINKIAEKYDMPILYSCHPRSRKRLEASGFQLDKRVIQHEPLGFHDYNCLQMNAFAVVSDSGTLPEESSFFTSVGHPFPAVCIRTSTERPEALDKGCFVLAGIDSNSLVQAVETAVAMNENGDYGIPVPDYVEENVSTKVVKIIQSYTGVVNKMVWRKF